MRGILVAIVAIIVFGTTAVLLWLREKKRTDKICAKLDSYYSGLKEKRKSIRIKENLDVVCKVTEVSNSHWSVFSKDISGEGICLHMPEILPENANIELVIVIPESKRVSARGRVVWVKEAETSGSDGKRQFNAGIQFTKINPADKDVLVDFIKSSLSA
ncbi:MAG: PilZ domain-containing protein [Candidatus Omnitrophota bacterium]